MVGQVVPKRLLKGYHVTRLGERCCKMVPKVVNNLPKWAPNATEYQLKSCFSKGRGGPSSKLWRAGIMKFASMTNSVGDKLVANASDVTMTCCMRSRMTVSFQV